MQKYKVTITRTHEYEIEVDEKVWDEAALKIYTETIEPAIDMERFAGLVAISQMRDDKLLKNGKGLSVKDISIDEDYDVEVKLITDLKNKLP